MAASTIQRPRSAVRVVYDQTVVAGTTLTAGSANNINTYSSRKFSDYQILFFIAGDSSTSFRVTSAIPASSWSSGKTLRLTSAHGATLENTSGVRIVYTSDTSITVYTEGANAYTYLTVVGTKIDAN